MSQGYTKGIPIDVDGTLSGNTDLLVPSQKAVKTYVDTGLALKENVANKDTDGTLASNSDTLYPSQKAVKTYSDTKVSKTGDETIAGIKTFTDRIDLDKLRLTSSATIDLDPTSSYNDFDPQGFSNIRLTTTQTNVDITGFISDALSGQVLVITNASTGAITTNFITLKHQSTSSASGNRIVNGSQVIGNDIILLPGEQCTLVYNVASVSGIARWGVQSVTRTTRKHIATTPAQITSNQNDYPTTGYDTLRLSTDASRDITGFANPLSGKPLIIMNVGSFNIVLKNQNASSSGANRMILGNAGTDVTILPNDCVTLLYDSTTTRWRLISKSF